MKVITYVIKVSFFIWLLSVLGACGNSVTEKTDDDSKMKSADEGAPSAEKASSEDKDGDGQPDQKKHTSGGYLTGYVVSAFDMEVDGQRYVDSEDFYTQQLQRIEQEAVDGGYEGYNVTFDAQIGLDDLKHNMKVYVVSTQDRGYASDTRVNERGQFRVSIPLEGMEDTYKVRTNKRVNVILTSPDRKESVKWCYNFSGLESEATVEQPALINIFQTKITRYACSAAGSSGIQIPAKEAKAERDGDNSEEEVAP